MFAFLNNCFALGLTLFLKIVVFYRIEKIKHYFD